jgi:putative MFS transporter
LSDTSGSAPSRSAATGGPPHSRGRSFLARQFPPFNPREWRVFWISTTAGYFDSYDGALLSLALRQIQQGLRIAEASLGPILSVIRLGYLGALLIAPYADVVGRRRLLLSTIIGYTLFTGLSAIAPDARSFVIAQTLARAFSGAEATVSLVILAEEVDAAVRGWAIGLQGALSITGYGMAAIVFAFITVFPYGWRGLYALALAPLLLIIPLRRMLPESRRFEREQASGESAQSIFEALTALFRSHPARISMVLAVWFLFALGLAPAGAFLPKFLQEIHHWSPGQVSGVYVFGGAIGILGNIVAGRISDSFGRRTMGIAFTFAAPVGSLALYSVGDGAALVACWIGWLFCDQAATTIINAFGTELFPTSQRAAAGSALLVARYGGGAIGLWFEGLLYGVTGGHWSAIRYLMVAGFAAALVMLIFFPETAGRELEAIAPEPEPTLGIGH